jgi:hypothetical protein
MIVDRCGRAISRIIEHWWLHHGSDRWENAVFPKCAPSWPSGCFIVSISPTLRAPMPYWPLHIHTRGYWRMYSVECNADKIEAPIEMQAKCGEESIYTFVILTARQLMSRNGWVSRVESTHFCCNEIGGQLWTWVMGNLWLMSFHKGHTIHIMNPNTPVQHDCLWFHKKIRQTPTTQVCHESFDK